LILKDRGWGLASYVRNIVIENNSITKPMQLLADGGGVYTNTPCPGCHVRGKSLIVCTPLR